MRQVLHFGWRQLRQIARELGDATAASLSQDPVSFRRRANPDHPRIGRIPLAFDEPVTLHADNQTSHSRRADLLGAGQLTDRLGATEYDNRERREARGRHSARVILFAQPAQQVDSGRMHAVSQRSTVFQVAQGS